MPAVAEFRAGVPIANPVMVTTPIASITTGYKQASGTVLDLFDPIASGGIPSSTASGGVNGYIYRSEAGSLNNGAGPLMESVFIARASIDTVTKIVNGDGSTSIAVNLSIAQGLDLSAFTATVNGVMAEVGSLSTDGINVFFTLASGVSASGTLIITDANGITVSTTI